MQKQFTITQTCETILNIEIVKEESKYIAKVKRDYFLTDEDEYECWIEDDGQLMTEPVSSDEEYDAIIETFCSYIKENGVKYARKCTCCGKGMNEGYFADYEYFCDNDCLYTEFPPEIWAKVTAEDEDSYYWTEWEDDNDYEYVLFNNQLIEL